MKKLSLTALMLCPVMLCAGCSQPESDTILETESFTEIQYTTTQVTIPETEPSTTKESIQESSVSAERQAVEAICIEYFGGLMSPYHALGPDNEIIEYENDADYLMQTAETLSERCLGNISGEKDLIEKARLIWIERLGAKYIEHIESDYIEVDGEKMRYERNHPPYRAEYYTEYDVWLIVPNAPSGVREDGVKFATPAEPPFLIIRGEDGMILGALI